MLGKFCCNIHVFSQLRPLVDVMAWIISLIVWQCYFLVKLWTLTDLTLHWYHSHGIFLAESRLEETQHELDESKAKLLSLMEEKSTSGQTAGTSSARWGPIMCQWMLTTRCCSKLLCDCPLFPICSALNFHQILTSVTWVFGYACLFDHERRGQWFIEFGDHVVSCYYGD